MTVCFVTHRTFRLFRVLRVFRLGARMRKLEIVADAVRDSVEVFGMLLLLLALALVVFSSLVYFCEQGEFVCIYFITIVVHA